MLAKTEHFYEFGVFRLDADEQVLFARGEPVLLTPKAFQTLLLLVQNSGHVVSKNELLQNVWAETYVSENTLSFNISSLRKTLAKFDESANYIETVPRRGFRFTAAVREIEPSGDEMVLERRAVSRTLIEEIPSGISAYPIEPPKKLLFAAGADPPKNFAKISNLWKMAGLVILAIGLGAGIYFWRDTAATPNQIIAAEVKITNVRSIAVLPLRSLGGENEKDFRMQITDALITHLGNLSAVAVRPTSAILRFADDRDTDALKVGRSLQVDAVLDGSLQRDGEKLRLTLQLVSTETGAQLWAQHFDQTFSDIFALQDAVSERVVQTLALELSRRNNQPTIQRPTESAAAYEAYLRGRFYWSGRTEKDFARSLEFFEQAIALDPKFADAYTGLADAYLGFYDYAFRSPQETVPVAKKALEKALQLNPNLSDARTSLAFIQFIYDWDAEKALKSSETAIALNPNNSLAHHRYGWFLMILGRDQEGLIELEKARELDPLSSTLQTNIGYAHFCARRYGKAIEQFEKVIAMDPNNSLPFWYMGASFYPDEKFEEMITAYVKALELDGESNLAQKIAQTYRTKGLQAAYRIWSQELERRSRKVYVPAYNQALLSALLKDREKTFANLKKAHDFHDPWLAQITHDPEFDFVRNDPRFREFVPFSN